MGAIHFREYSPGVAAGNVFAGYEQKFVFGAGNTMLPIRPVLFAIIKFLGNCFGRPFKDDEEREKFALAFESLYVRRAGQMRPPRRSTMGVTFWR